MLPLFTHFSRAAFFFFFMLAASDAAFSFFEGGVFFLSDGAAISLAEAAASRRRFHFQLERRFSACLITLSSIFFQVAARPRDVAIRIFRLSLLPRCHGHFRHTPVSPPSPQRHAIRYCR